MQLKLQMMAILTSQRRPMPSRRQTRMPRVVLQSPSGPSQYDTSHTHLTHRGQPVTEDTVEGEVEEGEEVPPQEDDVTQDDDQQSSGSMERRNDEPPPDDQIEAWHQHQKDMGRTDTSSTLAPLQNASAQDWLG